MAKLTGGEAIVASLLHHGIDTIFGLPGAQTYGLFDALYRAGDRVRLYGARHEQTCGYMAFGYSRSTGRPSAYTVVPGPGMLNTGAALCTALGCNLPVLCVTGQVPTPFLDRGTGHLHELPDQLATLRTLTKSATRMAKPEAVPQAMAEAFQAMLSGRRGPAAVEMPWDVFTQASEVDTAFALEPAAAPLPDTDAADRAARLMKAARAPMIFVGSGALDAGADVLELAEFLQAPVVAFRSGRGIVSDEHTLGLTIAAAYELWPETDLAIGIGTRMEVASWRWGWRPQGLRTIRVDIDPAEQPRVPADEFLLCDAKAGTRALLDAARRAGVSNSGRSAAIAGAKATAAAAIRAIQPQMDYLDAIRAAVPRDGYFCDELTQVGFTSWFGFPVYAPRTYITSGYQGTLGAGFPAALGVKVAHPDKAVVSVTGDGGFLFAATELATAVQYNIAVTTLVFNNNAYGNVRRDQQERFGGRLAGAELVNPDFIRFAESFGVTAERVTSPASLGPALERALASDKPRLIEIPISNETSPWRFIHPPKP